MEKKRQDQKKSSNQLQVFQLPVLQDNYIYILHDKTSQKTAALDPALAEPVNSFLKNKSWKLDFVLNTHHHWDHIGGNKKLKKEWTCQIVGFSKDAHRIPGIDICLNEGDEFSLGDSISRVLFLPGHTLGHIAYWFWKEKKLFCGDTLFAMGCGRLFEGTYQQMFNSLHQIKNLSPETEIYCAHEYTEKNGHFALSVGDHNPNLQIRMKKIREKRRSNLPTVPFLLNEDLKTNPFLQAETLEKFSQLRQKRDIF